MSAPPGVGWKRRWLAVGVLASAMASHATSQAHAFRIELKDVAPDRIERQRAAAMGQVPLPGTPNVAQFDQRLKEGGFTAGSPIFIRVFKAESDLEVWMQKGDRYELFATYPVCHWSGTLGPKVSEGDKQSPEGVYTVTQRQLHMIGRHPRSLNLGFPNVFDRQFQRTGSYILIHGGCGSVGCFAMTNPVIEEIFVLSQAALKGGQDQIHVHVFPFRLTEQRLQAYALHEWYDFWRNLKDVYDGFEKTKRPPRVSVCEGRYWVDNEMAGHSPGIQEVASQSPLAVCGEAAQSPNSPTESASLLSKSSWSQRPLGPPAQFQNSPLALDLTNPNVGSPLVGPVQRSRPGNQATAKLVRRGNLLMPTVPVACEMNRASCRKWFALQNDMLDRQIAAARSGSKVAATTTAKSAARKR
jgi:murein L,D-transpeptidase YafK